MPEYSLDKENIRREQEKDDFCTKQNPGDFSSNYKFFGTMMASCTGAAPKKNIRLSYRRL